MILFGALLGGCGSTPARQEGKSVALARELMVESAKLAELRQAGDPSDGQADTRTARSEAAERAVRVWRGRDDASND